jgi:hypothetical protein
MAGGAFAVDDRFAYVAELLTGIVSRVPIAGGPAEPLTRFSHEPHALAVDETFVYVAFAGGVARFPKAPATVPVEPTLLAPMPLEFGVLALYGHSILVAERAGRGRDIWSVSRTTPSETRTSVFHSANLIHDGLALAGDTLLWASGAEELATGEVLSLDLRTGQPHRLTQGLALGRSPVADAENCYFVMEDPFFVAAPTATGIASVRYAP